MYRTIIILIEDIHNGNNKCYKFQLKCPNKNGDRPKLIRRHLKEKREFSLVMVTGNAFQILIDLNNKLLAILLVRQKGFNRDEPVERVEIEEGFRILKWSSKFIEIKV